MASGDCRGGGADGDFGGIGVDWRAGLSSNVSRAVTALPLGAALAAAVGAAVLGRFGPAPLGV